MIKAIERGKFQDQDDYKDTLKERDPVIREDGLPTIEDWEKLLGKEGVLTKENEKEHESPCDMMSEEAEEENKKEDNKEDKKPKVKGVMVVKKSMGVSPLGGILSAMEPGVDLDKVDSRHDDIINFVESLLKLSR